MPEPSAICGRVTNSRFATGPVPPAAAAAATVSAVAAVELELPEREGESKACAEPEAEAAAAALRNKASVLSVVIMDTLLELTRRRPLAGLMLRPLGKHTRLAATDEVRSGRGAFGGEMGEL